MDHRDDARGAGSQRQLVAHAEGLLRSGAAAAALGALENGRRTCQPSERPYMDWLIGRALLDLGRRGAAYTTLQAALADPASTTDDAARARLLSALGAVHHAEGQFQAAAETFGRALYHAERLRPPDHDLCARLLVNLGSVALKSGQVEASTGYYERAVEAAGRADDTRRLGMAHMGLGLARQEAHDYAAAMSHAAQAITLFDRANDRRLAMQARINLALAHAVQEHWVEAMPHLNRVVEYARADADLSTEAHALELLARAHAFVGDHAGAVQLASQARVTAGRADDRLEASNAAVTEAQALVALGRVAEAEERFRMAIAYFQAVGASRRLVAASHAYAVALRSWGRAAEALEVLDHAYALTAHLQQGEDT
jgi:tetratricopeptide (TPR) repeat protein